VQFIPRSGITAMCCSGERALFGGVKPLTLQSLKLVHVEPLRIVHGVRA
jgi:hypothetical protein